MFVGHGLVAFAGAAGVASVLGYRRERVLALGVCAGAFALAPDVDIVYAPVGLADATLNSANVVEGFWQHGNLVHRAVTHSLVVGTVASAAAGCVAVHERVKGKRANERDPTDIADSTNGAESTSVASTLAAVAALALVGGLVGVAGIESGPLGAVVMGLFGATSVAIAAAGARWGLTAHEIGAAALFGLSSHPFGDLFTGEPPAVLYPLDVTLVAERVSLHPDPTLHLLGAFAIELTTFWAAALVYASLRDRQLGACIDWRAALGIGYAGAALALPAPTLDSSYQFVVSVLALGVVLGASPVPRVPRVSRTGAGEAVGSNRRAGRRTAGRGSVASVPVRALTAYRRTVLDDPFGAALTGLTAVTLALVAYTLTYVYAVAP